jgi:hypothetical protein
MIQLQSLTMAITNMNNLAPTGVGTQDLLRNTKSLKMIMTGTICVGTYVTGRIKRTQSQVIAFFKLQRLLLTKGHVPRKDSNSRRYKRANLIIFHF